MIVSVLYMLITFLNGGIIAPAVLILFIVADVALIETLRNLIK